MMKFNKGEWAELYTVCYILNNGELQVADDNLMPTYQRVKILKLFMNSIFGESAYDIKSKGIFLINDQSPVSTFHTTSRDIDDLFNEINAGSGRSFSLISGERIMKSLHIASFKASSYQKADINTLSIMPQEKIPRDVGFSIKSQIGGLATLLNASKSTNFTYEVVGFCGNDNDINSINSNFSKIKKRIDIIKNNGGQFIFRKIDSCSFNQNLRLVDSQYPDILADMLLCYFSNSGISSIQDIVKDVSSKVGICMTKAEIESKTKYFLNRIALGMIPTKVWDGNLLDGGCIFVKRDGNILCYTLYDMDYFNNYLFKNTKFDTASTKRHEFGKLFTGDDGKKYFKLNLDIRFIY